MKKQTVPSASADSLVSAGSPKNSDKLPEGSKGSEGKSAAGLMGAKLMNLTTKTMSDGNPKHSACKPLVSEGKSPKAK